MTLISHISNFTGGMFRAPDSQSCQVRSFAPMSFAAAVCVSPDDALASRISVVVGMSGFVNGADQRGGHAVTVVEVVRHMGVAIVETILGGIARFCKVGHYGVISGQSEVDHCGHGVSPKAPPQGLGGWLGGKDCIFCKNTLSFNDFSVQCIRASARFFNHYAFLDVFFHQRHVHCVFANQLGGFFCSHDRILWVLNSALCCVHSLYDTRIAWYVNRYFALLHTVTNRGEA